MKLEEQITSLQLSKKLKELGIKQESLFFWTPTKYNGKKFDYELHIAVTNKYSQWSVPDNEPTQISGDQDSYSAFTVAELGEIGKLEMISWYNPRFEKWAIAREYDDQLRFYEDTEADARARMLIYLIENNLLKL